MNWRALAFLALLLLTTLTVWWLLAGEQAGKRLDFALQEQQRAAGGNDYYMEGVRSQHFNAQGQLSHVLQSPRIEHDPKSARLQLLSPHLLLQHNDGEPWTLQAQSAFGHDDLQQINLQGDVRLSRGSGFKPNMTMSTESLQLDLHRDHASTDGPVRFVGQHGDIDAIGLDADLKNEVLNLQHQVRGRYAH